MALNGQLQKVVDAWPLLLAVTGIMTVLLTVFAANFIGEVVKEDISTVPKIIQMDNAITANHVLAKAVKDDTEDIKASQVRLEAKVDRLIEIMLTED